MITFSSYFYISIITLSNEPIYEGLFIYCILHLLIEFDKEYAFMSAQIALWLVSRHITQLCLQRFEFESRLELLYQPHLKNKEYAFICK